MTNEEIIANHVKNNPSEGNANGLMVALHNSIKDSFKVTKFNDVLFAHKDDGENCLFSMINGGGAKQYIQALRNFIKYIKQKGIKTILMYVSDENSARKIAESGGLTDIQFEDASGHGVDNILLIART